MESFLENGTKKGTYSGHTAEVLGRRRLVSENDDGSFYIFFDSFRPMRFQPRRKNKVHVCSQVYLEVPVMVVDQKYLAQLGE